MKRIFIFLTLMAVALNSFAYSSSRESSGDFFLIFLLIIAAILNVILFFKIWGMTNDIRALKKDHFNQNVNWTKESLAKNIRNNIIFNNMDKVKNILLQNFIDNVEDAYAQFPTMGYKTDENGEKHWTTIEEQNLKKSIRPYVTHLKSQYDKIGEVLPIYIQKMETFEDYHKLFTAKDLVIEIKEDSKSDEV